MEKPEENFRQATAVDKGWRARLAASPRQATVVDEGWRSVMANMLDPEKIMKLATANAYASMDDFKAAVAGSVALTSSAGKTYQVRRTLSREGGESIVLLCAAPDGRDVVAKVYFEPVNSAGSSISARVRVLEYMATEDGQKYTLPVSDIGLVEAGGSQYYFEIMPYCEQGDLSHERFSFDELAQLASYLNEALHSMHSASILHRDIKPTNLYRLDGRVVIGDFGVARLARAGVTGHTVGTDGYRAPESVLVVSADEPAFYFDEKCDYYSLGVTLGSLFEGRFVYEGMTAAMITAAVRQGRLPLSRLDLRRELLENLLNGLCRYDSRYRFGYEDVRRWTADHNYTGGATGDEWPRPFRMLNEEYRDEKSLFEGITGDTAHWDEGRELLYGKFFEQFFISFRPDLARFAQLAAETYGDKDKGLSVFLKGLFAPGPIVWRGYTFGGLRELAEQMKLTRMPGIYGELLQKHCISHWLSGTEGIRVEEKTAALVDSIERCALERPALACYWFCNSFAARRELRICNQTVSTIPALFRALFTSPRNFYLAGGYESLMDRTEGAALYGFLYSFGYQPLVDAHWEKIKAYNEFDKACALLALLGAISNRMGEESSLLLKFFLNYGPIGIAICTKRLAERTEAPVYQGLDADGRRILSQIVDFRPSQVRSVAEAFQVYTPLLELVWKLQRNLVDNPYCVSAGVYENKGILCTNLAGCFAFRIFGHFAPLGFYTWIESAAGGDSR